MVSQVVVIDTLREPVAKVLRQAALLVCQASTAPADDYLGTGAQASDDEEMLLGSGPKPETCVLGDGVDSDSEESPKEHKEPLEPSAVLEPTRLEVTTPTSPALKVERGYEPQLPQPVRILVPPCRPCGGAGLQGDLCQWAP